MSSSVNDRCSTLGNHKLRFDEFYLTSSGKPALKIRLFTAPAAADVLCTVCDKPEVIRQYGYGANTYGKALYKCVDHGVFAIYDSGTKRFRSFVPKRKDVTPAPAALGHGPKVHGAESKPEPSSSVAKPAAYSLEDAIRGYDPGMPNPTSQRHTLVVRHLNGGESVIRLTIANSILTWQSLPLLLQNHIELSLVGNRRMRLMLPEGALVAGFVPAAFTFLPIDATFRAWIPTTAVSLEMSEYLAPTVIPPPPVTFFSDSEDETITTPTTRSDRKLGHGRSSGQGPKLPPQN